MMRSGQSHGPTKSESNWRRNCLQEYLLDVVDDARGVGDVHKLLHPPRPQQLHCVCDGACASSSRRRLRNSSWSWSCHADHGCGCACVSSPSFCPCNGPPVCGPRKLRQQLPRNHDSPDDLRSHPLHRRQVRQEAPGRHLVPRALVHLGRLGTVAGHKMNCLDPGTGHGQPDMG